MAKLDTHGATGKARVRSYDLRALVVTLLCRTAEPWQPSTPSDHPVLWIKDDGRDICGKVISASALGAPAGLAVDR